MKQQIAKMSEEQIKEAEERAVTGHLPKETAVEETAATTTEENPEETSEKSSEDSAEQAPEQGSEENTEEAADPSETEPPAPEPRRDVDYAYIAENIANLSRMYIRIYRDGEPIAIEDPIQFPMDPATPYLRQLFQIDQKASYFITPYDQFYGILCYDSIRIILGPTFHMPPSRKKIREFMFQLGVKRDYFFSYQELLAGVTPMPLELFLHELCLIYYFISEEKLFLSDFTLYDATKIGRAHV